jgi:membrane protease YdiL (CAAX protease family)
MNVLEIRNRILRPILLPMGFSAIGFAVAFVFKKFLHFELDRLGISIIAFTVTTLSVLYLFPKVYKIPFGKVSVREWIIKVGLYKPEHTFKYIILGILLATITLSGMLFASFQIGGYKPDLSTITLGQAIFSLTPGIWEEILFRGVLMIALLHLTKSLKKAAIIQVVLFGLAHIKGIDLLSFIDAFFVMILAISFTYVTFKTKSLIPAIIFHYLHDTFIFFVQLPDDKYIGFTNNAVFYITLLISVILTMLITKKLVERFNIQGNFDFYAVEGFDKNNTNETKSSDKKKNRTKL